MRKIILGAVGASLLVCATGLHFAIPRVSVVQVVGVEVKRVDAGGGTRDVYMIQSLFGEGGAVRVFRNEDAPLYLKFNSADIQARAAALGRGEPPPTVAIRHYGWRIPVLSVFPNALSIREVPVDYRHVPLLAITLYAALFSLPLIIWRYISRRRAPSSGRARSEPSHRSDPASRARDADWFDTDHQVSSGGSSSDGGSGGSSGGSDA
jgi:hypothetical protein